jgi:hypothetical protein
MSAPKRLIVPCPGCSADVTIHPTTNRIANHKVRGEKNAELCNFSGDYLPGFTPPRPIRPLRPRLRLVATT